jgi:Rod binding domain-containing protein
MSDLSLTSAGNLRVPATGDQARLHKVAQQFEAAFVQQLMKPLDEQQLDDEPILGGDPATTNFRSLYHQGLSEQASGGLGIAEMVFKELSIRSSLPTATHELAAHPPTTKGNQP